MYVYTGCGAPARTLSYSFYRSIGSYIRQLVCFLNHSLVSMEIIIAAKNGMYSFKSFKKLKKAAAYKTILAFKNAAKATTIALRDLLRAYFRGFFNFFSKNFGILT